MQLHGQVASILKCKQFACFLIGECSSRNTVQFLNETDCNHECQFRKSLKKINCYYCIGLIVYATEKIHVLIHVLYVYCIFGQLYGNCLNFLLWLGIFCNIAYNVYERISINFSISVQKYSNFSKFSEISCAGMAIFAISLLLLMIFPSIQVILSESSK